MSIARLLPAWLHAIADYAVAASLIVIALAFTLVYLSWGTTYLAIKRGVQDEQLPPWLFSGTRVCLAGVLLLGLSARLLNRALVVSARLPRALGRRLTKRRRPRQRQQVEARVTRRRGEGEPEQDGPDDQGGRDDDPAPPRCGHEAAARACRARRTASS